MAILDARPGIKGTVRARSQQLNGSWFTKKGKILKEHENNENESESGLAMKYRATRTVSKYVESVSDDHFCVDLHVTSPCKMDRPALVFKILVDGSLATGKVLHGERFEMRGHSHLFVTGANYFDAARMEIMEQPFRFSKIETSVSPSQPSLAYSISESESQVELNDTATEGEELARVNVDTERLSKVGRIEIWVYRMSKPTKVTPTSRKLNLEDNNRSEVHEKAFKGRALSHATR